MYPGQGTFVSFAEKIVGTFEKLVPDPAIQKGDEENKRAATEKGDYKQLFALYGLGPDSDNDDTLVRLLIYQRNRKMIIVVSEDRNMKDMETISGMDAVLRRSPSIKERITSMLETINGDCILAIKDFAITCVRFETVQKFYTTNGDTTELINADRLYKYLYKDNEIWLVIGRTDGLKEEIQKDIIMTCIKAGFDNEYCKEILKRCNSDDNEQCKEVEERSENTLLRIIMSPTVEEFKNFMKKAILLCCCRVSLKIVYCGHGTPSGDFCLFDDQYEELYLNCCFAIDIASKINGKDALKLVENIAPLILEKDDAVASKDDAVASKDDAVASKDDAVASKDDAVASKDDAIELIVKAYYGDQDANQTFQKAYMAI
eukprot:Em0001g1168a